MADKSKDDHNHGRPHARLSRSRRSARAARHPQSRRTQQPDRGPPLRAVGIQAPVAIRLRGPTGHRAVQSTESPQLRGWANDLTAIADALGSQQFGVTGWSEGGPWALAAAAYIDPQRLRHVSSIAGGSYARTPNSRIFLHSGHVPHVLEFAGHEHGSGLLHDPGRIALKYCRQTTSGGSVWFARKRRKGMT